MFDYLRYFFNPAHLFALQPPSLHQQAITMMAGAFGLLLLGGLFSRVSSRGVDSLKAKGLKRLGSLGVTMGLLGYLYLFFAWQRAVLLGARFWLLIWLVVVLIWLFFILKYLLVMVPAKRREIDQRRRFERYLP